MQVKKCCSAVQMFKNMFLNLSSRMRTGFANVARTTASTS